MPWQRQCVAAERAIAGECGIRSYDLQQGKDLPAVQRRLRSEAPAKLPRDCGVQLHRLSKWRDMPLPATRGAWEEREPDTCDEVI